MDWTIYVASDKSLTIPKEFNIELCGEEEPTPLCYEIKVGGKQIRLIRSGEYPYNEICDEDKGDNKPTYLTFWENYQIVVPPYYLELIDANEGDAYEIRISTEKNIRLIKEE